MLKEIIKQASTVLVDVRTPWEYEMGHAPGAKNIPLDEIPSRIDEFKSIQQPVVVYCRSGARSGMATTILLQNGITNVYNGGGLADIQFLLN